MVTGGILKVIERLHNWVARRITGITVRRTTSGE